jgi:hypothetical protein
MWVRLVAHASGYFGQSLFDQTVRTPMLGQQRDAALVGFVVDPIEIGMQIDRGGLAGVPFDSVDPLDCFPRWITIGEPSQPKGQSRLLGVPFKTASTAERVSKWLTANLRNSLARSATRYPNRLPSGMSSTPVEVEKKLRSAHKLAPYGFADFHSHEC